MIVVLTYLLGQALEEDPGRVILTKKFPDHEPEHGDVNEGPDHGAQEAGGPALQGQDLIYLPAHDLGEAQQAQGLAGGSTIDNGTS